jgi:hypothetical protein
VRALLDQGADSNLQDNDGFTPLFLAACNSHLEVVRVLLVVWMFGNCPGHAVGPRRFS